MWTGGVRQNFPFLTSMRSWTDSCFATQFMLLIFCLCLIEWNWFINILSIPFPCEYVDLHKLAWQWNHLWRAKNHKTGSDLAERQQYCYCKYIGVLMRGECILLMCSLYKLKMVLYGFCGECSWFLVGLLIQNEVGFMLLLLKQWSKLYIGILHRCTCRNYKLDWVIFIFLFLANVV